MAYNAATRTRKISEAMAKFPAYAAMGARAITNGTSFSDFQAHLLSAIARDSGHGPRATPGLEVGADRSRDERWKAAAADAIVLRACGGRLPGNLTRSERDERMLAVVECGAHSLMEIGERTLRAPRDRVGNEDLLSRTIGASDMPNVLGISAEKIVQGFFDEQVNNFRPLARIRNVRDYKSISSVKVSAVTTPLETPELVPVSKGPVIDSQEQYFLKTYSQSISISRQAILTDDLTAFVALAEAHAVACSRLVHDLVFGLLVSNSGTGPVMAEDSLNLFATTHTSGANYIAAVGTPDVAGIGALSKLLRAQRGFTVPGQTGPLLNQKIAILLVPAALESVARATVASLANSELGADPAFLKNLNIICEPRLDAGTNGTTGWYLVCDPASSPGLEISFLNGIAKPRVMQFPQSSPLIITYAVVVDCAAKWVEHRSWARTRGA